MNSLRRATRSANRPATRRNPPKGTAYADSAHWAAARSRPKARASVGRATVTPAKSQTIRNWAPASTRVTNAALLRGSRPARVLPSPILSLQTQRAATARRQSEAPERRSARTEVIGQSADPVAHEMASAFRDTLPNMRVHARHDAAKPFEGPVTPSRGTEPPRVPPSEGRPGSPTPPRDSREPQSGRSACLDAA